MATAKVLKDFYVSYENGEAQEIIERALLVEIQGSETGELKTILLKHLPKFITLFNLKNSEYGENAQTLGSRGQFSDIWRKIAKLKTALWDGHEERLKSEGVDEILMDLIGHCFLILNIRENDRNEKSVKSNDPNEHKHMFFNVDEDEDSEFYECRCGYSRRIIKDQS